MSQPFLGTTQPPLEVLHLKATPMLAFDPPEQPFLRLPFRSRARKAFERHAFGTSFSQGVFDGLTARNGSTIPDHQQLAGKLTGEPRQKANDLGAFGRMVLGRHHDLSFRSESAHDRKMVTRQRALQNGGLPHGSVRTSSQWQERSRRISTDDGTIFVCGLFFRAGHRSSFPVWIASSSRWLAFGIGFCRRCLRARRRRRPWAG